MVAGLAAGEKDGFTGVEPRANLVSLDVLDNSGNGTVSDVLAACDWILKYKDKYSIDVANFSINAGSGAGIANDPIDKAVETLWLNGVVVVAAAGNYAQDGAESGVGFAPANDPFVITVGASDTNDTPEPSDDFAAPWSAWGYTQDGFRKPELAAPGRQLSAPGAEGLVSLGHVPFAEGGRRLYVDVGYVLCSAARRGSRGDPPVAASGVDTRPCERCAHVRSERAHRLRLPRRLGVGILDIRALSRRTASLTRTRG